MMDHMGHYIWIGVGLLVVIILGVVIVKSLKK
jgi:heme exporter protein D